MNLFRRFSAPLLGFFGMAWALTMYAIDISPSKPEGGRGGAAISAEHNVEEEKKPSLLQNPFKWLFPKSDLSKRVEAPPEFDADIQVGQKVYSTAEDDAVEVKMTLQNKSRNKYIMRFPTAQHFDFIIQDEQNRELYRWSSDKEFAQKLSTIIVNANEKLTYPGQEPLLIPMSLGADSLPPGRYRLVGIVTAEKPIRISTTFEVAKESPSSVRRGGSSTRSASPALQALPVDESLLGQ